MLFLVDDEIIRQEDFGNKMYFISSGSVDVFLTIEKPNKDAKKALRERDQDIDSQSDVGGEDNSLIRHVVRINKLGSGTYFGEIAMVTNLKRTTTVRAADNINLVYLTRENFADIKKEFPQVYLNFKRNIRNYDDHDFEFRRNMIKNTPYFRKLDREVIDEIVYLLKPNRYDPNTTIIKYGDITNKIHYLKQGEVVVSIPTKNGISQSETHFETLNAGSCFCAFSAFSGDIQQLVNFKARTSCIVETIDVEDLEYIERTYLQLSDEIKKLRLLVDNKDKSELDFFRYLKPLKREHKASVKQQVRKKFQAAVRKFTEMHRKDKNCLPNALLALRDIMRERRRKQKEILHLQRINTIKYLQEKSPLIHPSQDMNSQGVNMFINQTINNQYNFQNFNIQNTSSGTLPQVQSAASFGHKEHEELEMLRKMDEEARKEKTKTNQNLSKLLNLIEVHNGTLEDIESKFKKEFSDIKDNIRKIKQQQQQESEKLRIIREDAHKAQQEQAERFEREQQQRLQREQQDSLHRQQQDQLYSEQQDRSPRDNEGDYTQQEHKHQTEQTEHQQRTATDQTHKQYEHSSEVEANLEEVKDSKHNKKAHHEFSKNTLKELYPREQSPADKPEYSNSMDHDDVGVFAAPEASVAHKNPLAAQSNQTKKKTTKRMQGVGKNQSLKAPRDSTEIKVGQPNSAVFVQDNKSHDDESKSDHPELLKLNSNSRMLNAGESPKQEIDLTDEEDFQKDFNHYENNYKAHDHSHDHSQEHSHEDSDSESESQPEGEEAKKQLNDNFRQNVPHDEVRKKLSEASFEESSIGEHNEGDLTEEEQVDYKENMPRLNEHEIIADINSFVKYKLRSLI